MAMEMPYRIRCRESVLTDLCGLSASAMFTFLAGRASAFIIIVSLLFL